MQIVGGKCFYTLSFIIENPHKSHSYVDCGILYFNYYMKNRDFKGMSDCGNEFIVDSRSMKKVRCDNCYSIYRKAYKANAEKIRRKNKNNKSWTVQNEIKFPTNGLIAWFVGIYFFRI